MDGLAQALDGIAMGDDPALLRQKSRDYFWYSPILREKLDHARADLLITPRDEAEVIRILAECHKRRIPVTVRGAGTGNYGQAMPLKGGVVLDTTAMTKIVSMSPGRVRAQAGVRLLDLDRACKRDIGHELRLFPSTVRTSTLGGYIGGGSTGIGAVAWGNLADPGNILALRVVTMEASPRVIELRGKDIQSVNHAYGTNGVITELEIPLAPAVAWQDVLIGFPDFMAAVRFGKAFGDQPGIDKRLCTVVASPIPQQCFGSLGALLPDGHHAVLAMVAENGLDALRDLADAEGGNVHVLGETPTDGTRKPIYEYSWNHTTLHALKKDKSFTYLQVLYGGPDYLAKIERSYREFGDETPMHLEFVKVDGQLACFGLQLVRFTTPERLQAIMDALEAADCPVFDPHAFTIEEGGMKKVDSGQLDFKRQADPEGLLNPGKMLGWERPDWRPGVALKPVA